MHTYREKNDETKENVCESLNSRWEGIAEILTKLRCSQKMNLTCSLTKIKIKNKLDENPLLHLEFLIQL